MGETWAGSYTPEDHEFYGRSSVDGHIQIRADVLGLKCPKCSRYSIERIEWEYSQEWKRVPYYGLSATCSHPYMSNEVKNQLSCILIGTDRDLDYQLSYKSKWTTLSKLMHGFHKELVSDPERVKQLKGYYQSLTDTFNEIDSFGVFRKSLANYVRDFSGNMPFGLEVDFSAYDPSNFFHSLRIHPHLNGEAMSSGELGTGQAQMLALAFAYAHASAFGSQGLVLIVEEPESHLHPLAQEWVSRKLNELAEFGVQVVVSSHSPYFVDLSEPGSFVLVRKEDENSQTTVVQLDKHELARSVLEMGAPADKVNPDNVGAFYENSATNDIKAGLFSRGCILVEGATEKMGLAVLFERVGLDLVKEGLAIIPVNGITNMSKWVRFFQAHEIPVYCIFDTDTHLSGKKAAEARKQRLDIFLSLGLDDSLDWDERPEYEMSNVSNFNVLDPHYEAWMSQHFTDEYTNLSNEAIEQFGPSKSLNARWTARYLSGNPHEDPQWMGVRYIAGEIQQRFGLEPTLLSENADYQPAPPEDWYNDVPF